MAFLSRCGRARLFLIKRTLGIAPTSQVSISHWNTDWMPGPYPRTPEERAAAAKKYDMLPEDYEPNPDQGNGYGDYPYFPRKGVDSRDPNAVYDIPSLKRNYGEPVHVDADALREDAWSPELQKTMHAGSYRVMLTALFGVVGTSLALAWLAEEYPLRHRVMKKQLLSDEGKHYTFKLSEI